MALLPLLDKRSRACTAAMAGIYRRLLDKIRLDPESVLRGRVGLSSAEKAEPWRPWPWPRERHERPGTAEADVPPAAGARRRPQVVVVGGGLAGISAALACADAGRRGDASRKARASGRAHVVVYPRRPVRWTTASTSSCAAAPPTSTSWAGSARPATWSSRTRLDVTVLRPGDRLARRPGAGSRAQASPAPGPAPCPAPPGPVAPWLRPHPAAATGPASARAALALARLDLDDPALDEQTFEDWLRSARPRARPLFGAVGPDLLAHRQPAGERGLVGHGGEGLPNRPAHREQCRRHRLEPGAPRLPCTAERAATALRKAGVEVHLGRRCRRRAAAWPRAPTGDGRPRLVHRPHATGGELRPTASSSPSPTTAPKTCCPRAPCPDMSGRPNWPARP